MLKKFKEVNVFNGRPVEEDAPTNATGPAVAGTGDDSSVVVVRRKKDKKNQMFLDEEQKHTNNMQRNFKKCVKEEVNLKRKYLHKLMNFIERCLL